MKVLMFGWEFPPHISGGLGTACYGLTKGLSEIDNVDVTFVVPKAFGDEDQAAIELIGANTIPVSKKTYHFHQSNKAIDYLEVDSHLIPYVDEDEFWKLKSEKFSKNARFVETNADLQIKYPITGNHT